MPCRVLLVHDRGQPTTGSPADAVRQITVIVDPLSTREFEVLQGLASGATNATIAADLYLSRETVKSHVAHLLRKIGAPDRHAAVDKARRLGLLADADCAATAVA